MCVHACMLVRGVHLPWRVSAVTLMFAFFFSKISNTAFAGKDTVMLSPFSFVDWLCCHMCEQPHDRTHILPPLMCVVLGCQHSGSALHGGRRAVPGNRWWWPGRRAAGYRGSGHSENAADPVASAGWEQAKSWCRVFLLHPNKHCIIVLEEKVAPKAQCWWKMEGSQFLGYCSSTSLKSTENMLSIGEYFSHGCMTTLWYSRLAILVFFFFRFFLVGHGWCYRFYTTFFKVERGLLRPNPVTLWV